MTNKNNNNILNNDANNQYNPRIAIYIRCESLSANEVEEKQKNLLGLCARLFGNGKAHIYSDFNCSGMSRLEERMMFGPMMSRIEKNEYDILFVSNVSDISRDMDLLFEYVERITKSGVRILTPDGQMRWVFDDDGRAILI